MALLTIFPATFVFSKTKSIFELLPFYPYKDLQNFSLNRPLVQYLECTFQMLLFQYSVKST